MKSVRFTELELAVTKAKNDKVKLKLVSLEFAILEFAIYIGIILTSEFRQINTAHIGMELSTDKYRLGHKCTYRSSNNINSRSGKSFLESKKYTPNVMMKNEAKITMSDTLILRQLK